MKLRGRLEWTCKRTGETGHGPWKKEIIAMKRYARGANGIAPSLRIKVRLALITRKTKET